ncbi:MAG: hypothetical protein JRE40_11935, partial [Deltaproteobacteria bacterium]|nr:hypothetical protein [Deltaproteobacteria bacterium]
APAWMNVKNPLDVGPSGLFGVALEAALRDKQVSGVIAIPVIPGTIIKSIVDAGIDPALMFGEAEKIRRAVPGKPALIYTVGSNFWVRLVKDMFGSHLTMVSSPEAAAKALWELYRYNRFRNEAARG